MALADLITASAQVAGTVEGIVTVYPLPPEAAPPEVNLPAVIAKPLRGLLTPGASEMHEHTWQLHVLVKRGDKLDAAYAALLPFYDRIVEAFRSESTLGLANTYGVRLGEYEMGPVAYLDATYLGITWVMYGKQKFNTTYS